MAASDRRSLLAFVHPRVGRTRAQLAVGSGAGTTAACRRATEAVELLAVLAPCPADAVRVTSVQAYLSLDGALLPVDRIAVDRSHHSGKREKHYRNVQVLAAPFGGCCGSTCTALAVRDARAAREHGLLDALAETGVQAGSTRDTEAPEAPSASHAGDGRRPPRASGR